VDVSTTTSQPIVIAKIADALDDVEPELVAAILDVLDGEIEVEDVGALVAAGLEDADSVIVEAVVAALNNADDAVKSELESQLNVFSGALDSYKPLGSNVTVAERRTIVAITATVASPVSPLPTRRRKV
jgi:hypothetical protein